MEPIPIRDDRITPWKVVQPIASFVLMVGVFLQQSRFGVSVFDEGSVVSGAMLIGDGMIPYRDFFSLYGPGQYYSTAAVFSVLGETLSSARMLHATLLAALGMILFGLARRSSGDERRSLLLLLVYVGIVLFAKPNVGYPAITATALLLSSALPMIRWSTERSVRRLAAASALVGVSGLFRWDFGAFGLVAIASTTAIVMRTERRNAPGPLPVIPSLVAAVAPATMILAITYVPLLVMLSDPQRWYEEVLRYSVTEFPKWRSNEFVGPTYRGLLWALSQGSSALQVDKAILRIAYLGLPILVVAASLVTLMRAAVRKSAAPAERSRLELIAYLALLCLFLLNQMRVRPTLWQGFPAAVAALPLLLTLSVQHGPLIARSRRLTLGLTGAGFLLAAMLFNVALQTVLDSSNPGLIELDTPRSAGVHVDPEMRQYADLVRLVREKTRPGEAIFSGVQDHSRLVINDALLYFLADRPPADRFLALEPGISNTLRGQEEIVAALERKNVRVIVLADFPSDEPNQTSRSNGVNVLDAFIRANFHMERRIGDRVVMVRN